MLSRAIKQVLSNTFEESGRPFGSGGAVGRIATDLQAVMRQSTLFQYVAALMCVTLFIVYLVLVVRSDGDSIKLAALSTAFGISIAGLIASMMRMADRQVQSGTLLSLISALPQDDVLPALKALLDHERKQEAGSRSSTKRAKS